MEYNLEAFKSDTLATQLLVGGMSFTLSAGNFSDTPAGMYSVLVLEPKVAAKKEIITCTISGATVTIIARGVDGTSAVQHEINASVIAAFTPTHYTSIKAGAAQALKDGWQSFGKTLTYQSPTTVSGTDFLANNEIGDKFKCNQVVPQTSYWPFDSNSADAKGVATMTNIGTPTYTAGKFSNALTLNGTDQALAITDDALLKPTGAFTIGMWFKTNTKVAYQNLFQSFSKNTNQAGFAVSLDTSGFLYAVTANNTGTANGTLIRSNVDYADNAYHYVVFSFQSNHGRLFIDGQLAASGYMVAPVYTATNYVRVGCGNESGTNTIFTNGQIDDLFFINGHAVDSYWVAAKYAEATAQGSGDLTVSYKGYVVARTDTLLTLTGGADYALYNGTITNPYYSKASSPVGFPQSGMWNIPTLLNGWAIFAGLTVGYKKDSHGYVHLKGAVSSGTVGQTIFTLPEGYRPLNSTIAFAVSSNNGAADVFGKLTIQSSGVVTAYSPAGNTNVYLDGISFLAEN